MEVAAEVVPVLALAFVLTLGGVAKAVERGGTEGALRELGFGDGAAALVAYVLPVAEISCAAMLWLRPSAWWSLAAVETLFVLFAVAGAVAVTKWRTVRCACFGALQSSDVLGWRQVLQLGLASAAAAAILVAQPGWGSDRGLLGFSLTGLLAAAVLVAAAAPHARALRTQRLSYASTRIRARTLAQESALAIERR
jgi:Methylamine utilisation protein MauE